MGWTSLDGWYGQEKTCEYNEKGNSMNSDLDAVRDAAEQGDAKAQFVLGMMYATGRGAPFDYIQAHVWLSLGASQQHSKAIKERKFVAARMTLTQIAQAREMARNQSMVRG